MKLSEYASDDIKEKLQLYLPGRLAAINQEMDDNLTMIAPDPGSYFTGRQREFPASPAIFIMDGPTKFRQTGPRGLLSEIQQLVYVYETAQDGPQLSTRLKRQTRGIIEALFLDDPAERTRNGFNLTPMRTIPGSTFQPEADHDWRGFYVIVFKVEQEEA